MVKELKEFAGRRSLGDLSDQILNSLYMRSDRMQRIHYHRDMPILRASLEYGENLRDLVSTAISSKQASAHNSVA